MEDVLMDFVGKLPWNSTPWFAWFVLIGLIAVCLVVLAKGADWLVKEAVALSEHSGLPKVVIGATIVSLGTTAPEAAVSVLAAFQGSPGLALGNAVGSIICDTGLILGIACLIAPLPLNRNIVNRQGWVQLGAGILLVILSWPWESTGTVFTEGGRLPQTMGFLLLALLVWYIWQSIRWAKAESLAPSLEDLEVDLKVSKPVIFVKLSIAIVLVVGASHLLIPLVHEAASRMHVPEGIIAATLVAFGTSLPELVTAITAARHGHGDLAVGNIVGADILNVLFVSGAAAAVTPQGLDASAHFFRILFPAMLFVLILFRVGIYFSGDYLKRRFGVILILTYLLVNVFGYLA